MRSNLKPTKLQSVNARRLASLAQQWRALPEANRQKWDVFASSLRAIDRKLVETPIGGFQTFISCNLNLLESNQAIQTAPSGNLGSGTISITAAAGNVAAGPMVVTLVNQVAPTGVKLLYASQPFSPGRANFTGLPMRLVAVVVGSGSADRQPAYVATWCNYGAGFAGRQVLWRVWLVNSSGLKTGPYQAIMTLT